jgi:hypothetical protein
MLSPYKARVDERHFLNLPGFHDGAYVVAYVEDTSERAFRPDKKRRIYNFEPRLILELADCTGRINLEFDVHSALARKNSFHKVDTLIAALVAFQTGLAEECALYRERSHRVLGTGSAKVLTETTASEGPRWLCG